MNFVFKRLRDRHVDGQRCVAAVVVADIELDACAELVGRQARGHVDRAAVGVAAEQRALRAAQDLDALHLGEIHLLEAEAVLPDAVDVQADAGQAANVELRLGTARAGIQHDVRHHDAEVAAVGDAAELELLRREGRHRERRALQVGFTARGRDDDFFELRRSGERQCSEHGRG